MELVQDFYYAAHVSPFEFGQKHYGQIDFSDCVLDFVFSVLYDNRILNIPYSDLIDGDVSAVNVILDIIHDLSLGRMLNQWVGLEHS